MSWVFIAVLAAAVTAAATMTNKYVFVRLTREPIVQVIAGGVVGAGLSNIFMLFHGHGSLSGPHTLIALLAGVCFGLSLTANMYAVKHGTVSQVGPLRLLAPVMVAILAVLFLGETLTIQGYVGIVLIIAGAALLEGGKLSALRTNKVLGFMLLSGFMLALQQILTKYLLQFSDSYTILLYVRLGLLLFVMPILIKYFGLLVDVIKPRPWRNLGLLTVPGILGASGMFLVMFASADGPVAIVSALASLTPFFILLYVSLLSQALPDVYTDGLNKLRFARTASLVLVMFAGVLLILGS